VVSKRDSLGVNYSLSRHLQLFRLSEDCGRRHAYLYNSIQPVLDFREQDGCMMDGHNHMSFVVKS
jgi:hypothetical protein